MVKLIKETLQMVNFTDKEPINGLMELNTKEIINIITDTVMELTCILMVVNTKVNGQMAKNMEEVS